MVNAFVPHVYPGALASCPVSINLPTTFSRKSKETIFYFAKNDNEENGNNTSSGSREEEYEKAFEEAKTMKVKELREALQSRGISTNTMLEKTEFIKAYADVIADKVPIGKSTSTSSTSSSSSSSSSSTRKKTKPKTPEEPMDPSYRDVETQKFDKRRLMGQSVIDVKP